MTCVLVSLFVLLADIPLATPPSNASRSFDTTVATGSSTANPQVIQAETEFGESSCGSRPCLYSTGFEPEDGFALGGIVDQPAGAAAYDLWDTGCGGTTASVISTEFPGTGAQHLRLGHDPAKEADPSGFCVVAARVPSNANATAYPVNYNAVTISVDVAMTPFAGNYVMAPTAHGQFVATPLLFMFYGSIRLPLMPDGVHGGYVGDWDTTGGYQNLTIHFDPCTRELIYHYGGQELFRVTATFGHWVNFDDPMAQLLFWHNNKSGSRMDIDNVRIERAPGECENALGSCCDTLEGFCQEDVILSDCPPPNVWTVRGTCSTCFPAPGACCDRLTGECADGVTRSQCDDQVNVWTAQTSCDAPEAGECRQIYGTCCHTLYGGCTGIGLADQCFGPDRQFKLGIPCEPGSCPPANSACCVFDDTNVSGKDCANDVTLLDCDSVGGNWHRDQTCEHVNCQNAIPTVSEWGLVIIALLLLSGAKLLFGRREVMA